MERNILSALISSREAYDRLTSLLGKGDLTDIGQIVYDGVAEFYAKDKEVQAVDLNILTEYITTKYPKHAPKFRTVISSLTEISAPNVIELFCKHKRTNISLEMSDACLAQDDDKIEHLYAEYCKYSTGELEDDNNKLLNNVSIADIFSSQNQENKIALYPNALNDALDGGILPGHHVIVYARPDSGKSQFVINQAAGSLREGKRVLYIGNEDPEEQMLMRIICRITNTPLTKAREDTEATELLAKSKGYENLFFSPLNPGTFSEIRGQIERCKPDILIIDQLRNIHTGQDSKVLALEEAAIHARRIGKEYKIAVFSVVQAGDSATNKLVLDMGDVDFSNTGIPSQADVMIGLGMTEQFRNAGQLMLTIAKNKVNGEYPHFPVNVNKYLSKLTSI